MLPTSFRRILLFVATVMLLGIFSLANPQIPTAQAAVYTDAQLRVMIFECDDRYTPNLQLHDRVCSHSSGGGVVLVRGENQRGEMSTWDANKNICVDPKVKNSFEIPNWWWRFAKDVTITLGNGDVHVVKTGHTRKSWNNIGIRYVYMNIGGVRSPDYRVEIVSYQSDS
jgi:hypothetical protein